MENVNLSEFDIKVEKIKKLEEMGEKAYKAKFNKTHEIHDLEKYELGTKVSVAGRMTFKRTFGKLIFARLYAIGDNFDMPLTENLRTSVQISLSLNIVGDVALQKFKDFCDIGDFIGVNGELVRTQTGELTVQVETFELLSKALRGLPEKFHGLVEYCQVWMRHGWTFASFPFVLLCPLRLHPQEAISMDRAPDLF